MRALPVAASCTLLIWTLAHAADDREAQLASRFVELLRYDVQYFKYREACVAALRTHTPESMVAANPAHFNGILPGDKRWPGVLVAHENYYQEACSRPTKAEFVGSLAATYARELSTEQLKASIAFHGSSTGQALIAAHGVATTAVYARWAEVNGKYMAQAAARFQQELARLSRAK